MFKEKNAVINKNQDNKAHSLADFIVFHFKDVDSENDNNVEKTENE